MEADTAELPFILNSHIRHKMVGTRSFLSAGFGNANVAAVPTRSLPTRKGRYANNRTKLSVLAGQSQRHTRTRTVNRRLRRSRRWPAGSADAGTTTVFSDRLFRCRDSVLGLRRIERNALSAVVTR